MSFSQIGIAQDIWYVKTMATGDGTSWVNATGDLQEAIDSADTGDYIWIAAGTYYPTVGYDADGVGGIEEREKTFYIDKNIKIYGGFTGTETDLDQRSSSNMVILSGDIDMVPEMPESSQNAYHVLFMDGSTNPIDTSCRLEGLTIELGRALNPVNPVSPYIHEKGAGVYLNGSAGGSCSPTFVSCHFTNNSSGFFGRGGHMYNNGSGGNCCPVIKNCIFIGGYAREGGGIYNASANGNCSPQISGCQFTNNQSADGGAINCNAINGICSLKVSQCEFIGNMSTLDKIYNGDGGAISYYDNSAEYPPQITNSLFRDNSAGGSGGGIYMAGTGVIANCQFINNSGSLGGGIANAGLFVIPPNAGVLSPNQSLIVNCSFFGNNQFFATDNLGNAIHNSGNLSNPRVVNSILWGDNAQVRNQSGALAKFTNSIIQGSGGSVAWVDSFGIDGGNNLDHNPMYVSATDLQLMPGSPGIDAGVNDSIPMEIMTDYKANPRIVDGTVDMGPFEDQNCHNDLILDETDSPLIGSYFATGTITIEGATDILTSGHVKLSAPEVLINSGFSIANMQQLDIDTDGCPP